MEPTFGSNNYRQMRAFYEGSESAVAQLAVIDPSQALRPTLTAALTAFKGRPCNRVFFRLVAVVGLRESKRVGRHPQSLLGVPAKR